MLEKNEDINIVEDELNEDELNQVSGGAGQAQNSDNEEETVTVNYAFGKSIVKKK